MSAVINTNIASLNAQRNLSTSQSSLATSLQRLSSGLRINSAKDDAAGLAISERMTSQIKGTDQAVRNANDGISLAQTAEGDLGGISTSLQRIRELAVQSSNGTNSSSDRAAMQQEVSSLVSEIDRVAQQSSFNGLNLLNGTFAGVNFQVGANAGQTITVGSIVNARSTVLGGYQLTSTATTTALAAGDLTIAKGNGTAVSIVASSAGSGAGQAADSAWAIAQAINSSGAGVAASAANTVAGAAGTAGTHTGYISINGINTASFSTTSTLATDKATAAQAINNISNQTGVTASINSTTGNLDLTAADGRNIVVAAGTATLADVGLTAATNHGTVTITSDTQSITFGGAHPAYAGLTAGAQNGTLSAVSSIDISTAAGAASALAVVDASLTTVNGARAALGAIQNRFSSVVSSLQTSSENLSAARSRIQDADFAQETANLTRAQILQQAGTAMLAQANALPQQVLTLLK